MKSAVRAQIAAIIGIFSLAAITVVPWVVQSYVLRPQETKWHAIITQKQSLELQLMTLDREAASFQNMAEKKQANANFRKNIEQSNVDSIQGFVNSSSKFQVFNFKTTQVPDSREIRFSLIASYNSVGQVLTEIWNTFQFIDMSSLIMKPSPNKPDEEVMVTIAVRLP